MRRDPTPDPPDQLGGLVVVEHAADRAAGGISAALSGIKLVALAELGALVGAPEPCPHAGFDHMLGIHDDNALQAPGGIAANRLAPIWPDMHLCGFKHSHSSHLHNRITKLAYFSRLTSCSR
jgi:hypothetical protein